MEVLVIAPHPDDEVLGVGGTLARHAAEGDRVTVCIATKGQPPLFPEGGYKATRAEAARAHECLGVHKTIYLDFPAANVEAAPRYELNARLLNVILEVKPEILYIPHFEDMQKDHQLIVEAVMVAIRPKYAHRVKEVYMYETLSETEWNLPHPAKQFTPNYYVDISGYLDKKLTAFSMYESQRDSFPNPRSEEAIRSLAGYRGSNIMAEAAEAFEVVRVVRMKENEKNAAEKRID